MAINAVLGNKFVLFIDGEQLNCETSSNISISSEGTPVRCKSSGEWEEFLDGGIKTGTIGFDAIYVKNGTGSAFALLQKVGGVFPFIWGGIEPGDEVLTGNMRLNSLDMEAALDTEVTFSGEGSISGEPIVGVVST
jgi:hypothetical protein